MSPKTRKTPLVGAALAAVAGGTLVVLALLLLAALRLGPGASVTAHGPSTGPRTITLPLAEGGQRENGTAPLSTAVDAVRRSLETLLGPEDDPPSRTAPAETAAVADAAPPATPSTQGGDLGTPPSRPGRDGDTGDVSPRAGGSLTQTLTPDPLSGSDRDRPKGRDGVRDRSGGKDAGKQNAGKKQRKAREAPSKKAGARGGKNAVGRAGAKLSGPHNSQHAGGQSSSPKAAGATRRAPAAAGHNKPSVHKARAGKAKATKGKGKRK